MTQARPTPIGLSKEEAFKRGYFPGLVFNVPVTTDVSERSYKPGDLKEVPFLMSYNEAALVKIADAGLQGSIAGAAMRDKLMDESERCLDCTDGIYRGLNTVEKCGTCDGKGFVGP